MELQLKLAPSLDCPSAATLVDFSLGRMTLERMNAVSGHVESCRDCETVLEAIEGMADALVEDLQVTRLTDRLDENLRQQMALAEQIGIQVWSHVDAIHNRPSLLPDQERPP